MKILLLNPNTSSNMTEQMARQASTVLAPGVELTSLTATRGMPYIASRAEALIAGGVVLEMLAEHHPGYDAMVIAAFGDPGLVPARELFDVPVTAMAEAAMLTACMLGKRFAIVTFSTTLVAWYEDAVALAGLANRCTGIHVPAVGFNSVATVQHELENEIAALATRVAVEHAADVVILAGAPLTGLADRIRMRVPVPLIDPLSAAVGQAQLLARLQPRPSQTGRFARPAAKAATGLSGALGGWVEHRDKTGNTDISLSPAGTEK